MKLLALAVFLFSGLCLFAQTPRADSLRQVLRTAKTPEQAIDIQGDLAMELYETDWQQAFRYAEEVYRQAEKARYQRGQKRALTLIGVGYYLRGELDSATLFLARSNQLPDRLDWSITAYNWIIWAATNRIQSQFTRADSLLRLAVRVLEQENNAELLAVAYRHLGVLKKEQYQLREADLYYQRALSTWILLRDAAGQIAVRFDLAELEISRSNFTLAQQYLAQACDSEKNRKAYYQCYYLQAKLAIAEGQFRKAWEPLTKALEIFSQPKYKLAQALIRSEIGQMYSNLNEYEPALRNYLVALRLFEELGAVGQRAGVFAEIAWIYKNQGDFRQAHEYINRSLEIRSRLGDQSGISTCYNILGLIEAGEKNYAEAIANLNRALSLRQEIGYIKGVMDVQYNLSYVYSELNDYARAAGYLRQSIEIARQLKSPYDLAYAYNGLGALQIKTGAYQNAEKSLDMASEDISMSGSKLLLKQYLRNRADLATAKGQWQQAAHYLKQEIAVADSLAQSTNALKMAEIQALYDMEKKNREIEQLASRQALQDVELARQRWVVIFLVLGILLVVISGVVLFLFYRQRIRSHQESLQLNKSISEQKEEIQAQTEELMEANQTIANINSDLERRIGERTAELAQAYKELDTFFYRSSHDFRRPITTFLGLAEVAKVTVKDDMALQLFDKVSETARNLDRMLIKLQSISELGLEDQHPQPVDVQKLLDEVIFNWQTDLLAKDMNVSAEVIGRGTVLTQPAWLRLVTDNLLENAIQFCAPENPEARIFAVIEPHQFTLQVEDNGQGIPQEYQARIFDMYFRASVKSKGNGLGLYVVKKVVEKLRGTVGITSTYGKGTRIQVSFPCELARV